MPRYVGLCCEEYHSHSQTCLRDNYLYQMNPLQGKSISTKAMKKRKREEENVFTKVCNLNPFLLTPILISKWSLLLNKSNILWPEFLFWENVRMNNFNIFTFFFKSSAPCSGPTPSHADSKLKCTLNPSEQTQKSVILISSQVMVLTKCLLIFHHWLTSLSNFPLQFWLLNLSSPPLSLYKVPFSLSSATFFTFNSLFSHSPFPLLILFLHHHLLLLLFFFLFLLFHLHSQVPFTIYFGGHWKQDWNHVKCAMAEGPTCWAVWCLPNLLTCHL